MGCFDPWLFLIRQDTLWYRHLDDAQRYFFCSLYTVPFEDDSSLSFLICYIITGDDVIPLVGLYFCTDIMCVCTYDCLPVCVCNIRFHMLAAI